jgi:hypothetical protein
MAVGRRIKRSGIDGFDAYQEGLGQERKIVCGGKEGRQ